VGDIVEDEGEEQSNSLMLLVISYSVIARPGVQIVPRTVVFNHRSRAYDLGDTFHHLQNLEAL
jgi:hypothetical protein